MKKNLLFLFAVVITGFCNSQEIVEKDKKEYADVPFAIIEEVPVFPGCEKVSLQREKKGCLNSMMQKHIVENFNLNIVSCLEEKEVYNEEKKIYEKRCVNVLSRGKKRIYLQFKIGKTGEIEDIFARAPHPKLKEEAIRIAKLLPQMKPGLQKGKPVRVGYTLPITFNVE
ncbi:energy transducer TonB [Tenacibaculum caenipelagi]|uniref:TonB-like protein n=1 Tax=Tenacibaculum caenipelagi TaxID=1325435 RepID=A0A4R6TH65_9FLAO|nr:energy transducer TonB [Tenacibaculum caenipelagi]TDQ28550.1 TonB-like protein [Tenacibaculum caenipelagi]